MATLALGSRKGSLFAHLGTKNVFSHLVETPFLALYMDFGVDG